jgi:hypothetical protein
VSLPTIGPVNSVAGTKESSMPGFAIEGERSPIGASDTIEFVDEIRRNDMVTFVLARPGEYHVRVVKPAEYSTFCGLCTK